MELTVMMHNDEVWDITEFVTGITITEKLNDGCSKLEFKYLNIDKELEIENGCVVRFSYDDYAFVGRIFKHGQNTKKEVTVTAYDQLRYAKAKDYFTTSEGETIASLIRRMCNKYGFNIGDLADVKYKLKTNVYDGKTWLDILYGAIKDTLYESDNWYVLRDEAGYITLRDVKDLALDLTLGDESLVYSYDYGKTIDNEFYNRILFMAVKGDTGTFVAANDEESIKKYGLLQYYERKEDTNKSQAKTWADIMLKDHNREEESLSLSALGDIRVRAGTNFYVQIEDIMEPGTVRNAIVRSVTHKFIPLHTMDIVIAL